MEGPLYSESTSGWCSFGKIPKEQLSRLLGFSADILLLDGGQEYVGTSRIVEIL